MDVPATGIYYLTTLFALLAFGVAQILDRGTVIEPVTAQLGGLQVLGWCSMDMLTTAIL